MYFRLNLSFLNLFSGGTECNKYPKWHEFEARRFMDRGSARTKYPFSHVNNMLANMYSFTITHKIIKNLKEKRGQNIVVQDTGSNIIRLIRSLRLQNLKI